MTFPLLLFLLTTLDATSDVAIPVDKVPAGAVRCAQQWLDTRLTTDPALDGARVGQGYLVITMTPRRTIDFMRSDTIVDPTGTASASGARFRFPILKGDSCFSTVWVDRDGTGQFLPLGPLEHSAAPLDVVVSTLDRLIANGSHRVWVFDEPSPICRKTVIAERPSGERSAFELDYMVEYTPAEMPNDSTLLALGEPVAVWAERFRKELRIAYDIDQPRRRVAHDVPAAASIASERSLDALSVESRKSLFGVTSKPTLGAPWIYYQLNAVEQLLWAQSDSVDPTIFDADPFYIFPVIVEGERIATIDIRRTTRGCSPAPNDTTQTYRMTSTSHPNPGRSSDYRPDDLKRLGDVAVLNVTDIYTWYHVVGLDSTWIAPFYPANGEETSKWVSHPQPVSEMTKSIKESIQARYIE